MVGIENSKEILNKTLLFYAELFKEHNITDWFIGYGTLLGIIRGNSCIEGDDDVDILINNKYYDQLKKIIFKNEIVLETRWKTKNSPHILKTCPNDKYASVDFYMCDSNDSGSYYDNWEKVLWTECYDENNKLVKYAWKDSIINIPFNVEKKLIGRYGQTWKIPQKTKGPVPRKKIL